MRRGWGVTDGCGWMRACFSSRGPRRYDGEGWDHDIDLGGAVGTGVPMVVPGGWDGSQMLAAAAFYATDALLLIIGADATVVNANPAMTSATGWSDQELAASPFWEVFVAPEDYEGARADFAQIMADGRSRSVEGDWLDRAGGRRRISMQLSVIRDDDARPYALSVVGIDVTEQRREQARMRLHAESDALTGLGNRRSVFRELGEVLGEGGGGCGVLFCDIDGLKAVNDHHGHHVGDLVLIESARRLEAVVGASGSVARLGGDEFVVLCPGAGQGQLFALGAQLERALGEVIAVPGARVGVGVSIGSAFGREGSDPDQVVRAADRGMYQVKRTRQRARHLWSP